MVVEWVVNGNPYYTYATIGDAAIMICVGAFTTVKIFNHEQNENKWFGLVIAGGIAAQGCSLLATILCFTIYPLTCHGFYTLKNFQIAYVFAASNTLSLIHFWVFSVKYFETGLKYSFVTSDVYLWARNSLYFIYLPANAYFVGGWLYKACTYPVFSPPAGISDNECILRHSQN